MRAIQLTTHFNMGGIANYVLYLARALKEKGIDCIIASSGGDLVDELQKCGIVHKFIDIRTKFEFGPKVFRTTPMLTKIIKDERIDIVHAHTRVTQALAHIARRITGVTYVTTCHGFFRKTLSRRLFDFWGERVIAISEPVETSLVNDFKVSPERISLIHNGVDINRFNKEYSRDELSEFKYSIGLKDGPVIGTIGRLSPVKGHRFFIQAMKGVISKRPDAQGLIIGDGPEEANLKNLSRGLGLEGSLTFLKSIPDTERYLALMDIFVFPSIKEGLGLSLLEAMASGLPSIASNVGGISDLIKDGENGMLFDVSDVDGLTGSILHILSDEGLALSLGRSARNLVRERFSLNAMADKVYRLYREVLNSYAA